MTCRFICPVVAVTAALLAVRASAVTQTLPAATVPSTSQATETLKAEVIEVTGTAQYRTGDDQPWQWVTPGMTLDESAEIRTGPRSQVKFVIPPDQTVTVDRNTNIKILESFQQGNKATTRLGMKYGRTRYDIEAAGLEHDGTITAPSATLAMRGTQMVVTDQRPFPAQVVRLTGRADFRNLRTKRTIAFGSKGAGRTVVTTEKPSAAGVSLAQSVIDPNIALARTEAEAKLVAALLSSGATVEYDYEKGIKVVRGGQPPVTDASLLPTLPGRLNFVMRWTGNTDLNMIVSSPEPGNNIIYPFSGLSSLPSGGRTNFDHQGGSNGGIEICWWPAGAVPAGIYGVGALHISGENTPATLDVFLDGQRVPIEASEGPVTTANFTGEPINPEIASGIFVGNVRLSDDQAAVLPQSRKGSSRAAKPAFVGPVAPQKPVTLGRKK